MVKALWVEEFRPKTIDGYVFKNPSQKAQIQSWINERSIPHLIFYGGPGTGKTTLAKILINELGVHDNDVMYINASRDNSVDYIKQKIISFSEVMPWGDYKIVLLDEADYISQPGQAILRGVMEQFHEEVRFILTCNYEHKIMSAIKSRCQSLNITNLDTNDFTMRVAEILATKEVDFDLDTLDAYVKANYPDLRKTINSVQQHVTDGKLATPSDLQSTDDWRLKMVALFRSNKLLEARKWIISNATVTDIEGIYTFFYRNLEFFGATQDEQDSAVIIIRDGIVKHSLVADVEINLSATMIQLENIGK